MLAPSANQPHSLTSVSRSPSPVGPRVAPVPPKSVREPHGRRWMAVGLLLALGMAGGIEVWRHTAATPAIRYVTAAVTRGTVARSVTASGSVNPVLTVQVGTYVSGAIQELFCDYNTLVKKGQRCAKIDPRPYQTIVDQDRANLSAAKAQLGKDQTNLSYTRLTYERTLGLLQRGIVAQDALDSAKSAYDQAQSQLELDQATVVQHQAALSAAEVNLDYTNIVSPVNGTVVSRNVTMGQTVAASFQTPTLFLIATDLTKMQVDANVSESDIGGVTRGRQASFTVEAFPDHTFAGEVTQVRQAPQTVQNVVTYDVVVSAPNPDLLLKPGMTATIRIVVDRRDDVVRVPDQALRYSPGGVGSGTAASARDAASGGRGAAHVWVLRDGRPVQVPVTVGLDDDTAVEIAGGNLEPGDQVVISEQGGNGTGAAEAAPRFIRL
jgi:HlyD family secretion protein